MSSVSLIQINRLEIFERYLQHLKTSSGRGKKVPILQLNKRQAIQQVHIYSLRIGAQYTALTGFLSITGHHEDKEEHGPE